MSIQDVFTMIGAVFVIFGGGAAILIGLSSWLGDLWAKRILQTESALLQTRLDKLSYELSLAKSSYDKRLDPILEYYALFYRHYRFCQRTTRADGYRRLPAGEMIDTKDAFLAEIDQFIVDWASQEGRIRLLLPSELLALHEEAVERFNEFKQAVDAFTRDEESREKKRQAFSAIENLKSRFEDGLRKFLRTEKLLEWKSDL